MRSPYRQPAPGGVAHTAKSSLATTTPAASWCTAPPGPCGSEIGPDPRVHDRPRLDRRSNVTLETRGISLTAPRQLLAQQRRPGTLMGAGQGPRDAVDGWTPDPPHRPRIGPATGVHHRGPSICRARRGG